MEIYLTAPDAVFDLHKKGFSHDFQISGNDLMWVQEKFLLRAGEFAIKEWHQFKDSSRKETGIIILGVVAVCHNVKGILIKHYSGRSLKLPPVLLKKLNDLFICSPELLPTNIF